MFKETVTQLQSKQSKLTQQIHRKSVADIFPSKEEQKSDTDSGHSSIHGEKELIYRIPSQKILPVSKLTVSRPISDKIRNEIQPNHQNVWAIGDTNHINEKKEACTAKLQVIRRKDAILRRRNMQRRNTIDINHIDILRATNEKEFKDMISSKSINCLDRMSRKQPELFNEKINRINLNGSSMPSMMNKKNYCFCLKIVYEINFFFHLHIFRSIRCRKFSNFIKFTCSST